jgi:hypothetical protein
VLPKCPDVVFLARPVFGPNDQAERLTLCLQLCERAHDGSFDAISGYPTLAYRVEIYAGRCRFGGLGDRLDRRSLLRLDAPFV